MEDSAQGHREMTVMTLNVYFGTDLSPVFTVTDLPGLIVTIARMWEEVLATDIPARARSIAHQIAAAAPDLVGLQEIARWSTGTPGAMSVSHDFLLLILEALQREGAFYTPIAIAKGLDQAGPLDLKGNFLQIEDRDAVLLRIEPGPTRVRPYNIEARTFTTLFQAPNPVVGLLQAPRSWIVIDAMLDDQKFRFIETHIESLDEAVQVAQNQELVAGSRDTELPIIMVGDFNSNAHQQSDVPDNTPTYPELIAAGFQDTWDAVNSGDPGNTCCHAPDLRNIAAELNRRIDLILTRGAITPISAKLVGAEPSVRTASGVWPTDHAGVLAKLRFD
jgi:endonuclease/exonuclease/phosphatase family metal-dependent hydrolase